MKKSKSQKTTEERREYPRIVLDSPANIHYKIHQLGAMIHDISPDGIQIHADSDSFKKMNPDNETITESNAPLLDVTFCLKLHDMDLRINALCKMYYSNSIADNEGEDVVCGLKFVNFQGDGSSQLDAFISQEMSI